MAKNENIFAADQLINDMHEFHASHIAELQAGQKSAEGIPRELSSLHAQVVSFGSKTRSFFHRYEARLRKRMDDQMTSDDEQELERESGNFRDDFASADRMMRDRLPAAQSAGGKKLYPSPDPAGNIFGGNSAPGSWTLTFDDGPHPIYTMQIMHNMDALGFRPTFFWLGMNLQSERLKAIAAYAKSKSYVLGNHSMTHINFQGVRAANMSKAIQDEVIHPSQIDDSVYTYHPQFYRCPYGACLHVPPVRQAIANLHDIHVFWSVDSLDWNRAANPNGPSDIVNRVRAQMQKATHGVVLFHDIHPQSVLASNEIAKFLKANASKGFRHIDLCQVVDEANGDPQGTYCHGHADP
jgi:peptidoglycan/xylan/chitin deacetylase (PgdA/CDA1 family)